MNTSLSLGIPILRERDGEKDLSRADAARRGDRAAFDSFVLDYQRDLRMFLRRRVSEAEIEDILQDTWVAAWSSLHTFDKKSRFKTWLFAIALNKTRDHYRLRKNKATQAVFEDLVSNEDLGERTLLKELVRSALEHLTQSQKEVLELYYFAGFTLPETAKALNRNLNTVKYQFYRAHVEVADHLKTAVCGGAQETREIAWS